LNKYTRLYTIIQGISIRESPPPGLFGVTDNTFDEIGIPLFEKVFID